MIRAVKRKIKKMHMLTKYKHIYNICMCVCLCIYAFISNKEMVRIKKDEFMQISTAVRLFVCTMSYLDTIFIYPPSHHYNSQCGMECTELR